MKKLFGFVRARGTQPARLVRVEASGTMSRDELRRKLTAISARKQRACAGIQMKGQGASDEQPPSRRSTRSHDRRGRRGASLPASSYAH